MLVSDIAFIAENKKVDKDVSKSYSVEMLVFMTLLVTPVGVCLLIAILHIDRIF